MSAWTGRLGAACVGLVLAGVVQAAPRLDETMRAVLQDRVDSGELAGVVVGIVEGDERAVYGFARKGSRTPDAHTVYEIGSVTKTFTGLLLADAVTSGRAKLEQPVAALLPGYSIAAFQGRAITLLDLATQTSGLPRLPSNLRPAQMDNPYAGYTGAELKAFLAGYQADKSPGTGFLYSNLGFGLLGQALSASSDKSYEALVRERIAGPLGMASTGVTLSPSMRERLAPGHDALGSPVANWDFDAMAGGGALRSDAADMLRYVGAMMRPAPESAYALARTPQRPAGKGARIALGWLLNEVRGTPVVWHNGMTGGYASFAGFTADGRRGVVVLANSAVSVDKVGMDLLAPGAPPEPERVTLAPQELAGYAGRYQLAPGAVLSVRPRGAGLLAELGGQWFMVLPSAKDAFFARSVDLRIGFRRDASGVVESLVLHQNGRDSPARRLPAMAHTPVAPDAGLMQAYPGTYILPGGVALAVTLEGGQLYGQASGQERFPLHAFARDAFFHAPDAIEIRFQRNADGKVEALRLRQDGGPETPAMRQPG